MSQAASERLRVFRARCQEYLRRGYDRFAAARHVVDAAASLQGPALDVGTGQGFLALELARRGLDVVSVDVDAEAQELARLLAEEAGLGSRITFVPGDSARLPYLDGHFGCAAMMDVLHHLDEPGPVLLEMGRVVAAGGHVVIAEFDEPGFELVSRVHREEGREHPRTAATLGLAKEELRRAGFRCTIWTRGHLHEVAVLLKRPRDAGSG
jgi:ubiquinone/menaquinone biosynthesis C-methylase UbiE